MTPLVLPLPNNVAWSHAREIVAAFRIRKKQNPLIIAAVVNGFAESWWSANAVGDHDQSFGPWQLKFAYYGAPILNTLGVDIRSPTTTLAQHVDAVLFALTQAKVLNTLEAATNGADATRMWAANFERASAAGAVERRVAIAPPIEVWLATLP